MKENKIECKKVTSEDGIVSNIKAQCLITIDNYSNTMLCIDKLFQYIPDYLLQKHEIIMHDSYQVAFKINFRTIHKL